MTDIDDLMISEDTYEVVQTIEEICENIKEMIYRAWSVTRKYMAYGTLITLKGQGTGTRPTYPQQRRMHCQNSNMLSARNRSISRFLSDFMFQLTKKE